MDQLISNTRILESKLAEAKTKKDTLKARAASAKTSRQINEMLGNVSTGKTALEAFDRMEEKVMALEAESEAAFAVRVRDMWGCWVVDRGCVEMRLRVPCVAIIRCDAMC